MEIFEEEYLNDQDDDLKNQKNDPDDDDLLTDDEDDDQDLIPIEGDEDEEDDLEEDGDDLEEDNDDDFDPNDRPTTFETDADFSNRSHGRTTGTLLDHEPGLPGPGGGF